MSVSGPVGRRRVLQLGIVSLVGACSGHRAASSQRPAEVTVPSTTTTTTTAPPLVAVDPGAAVDVLILQTASSLEHYASGIYTTVAGLDVAGRTGLVPLLTTFAGHHADHAASLESATLDAGGRTVTQPNRLLSQAAMRRLPGLRTAKDVLEFIYAVEALSEATHRQSVGLFENGSRNSLIMGIGGVEARHIAVLGMKIAGLTPSPLTAWPPWPVTGLPGPASGVQPGVGL
jgi:hypothetical protein